MVRPALRRECYERFGLYKPDFKNSGDYELMLRFMHKHRIKVEYIPEVLVTMREGGVNARRRRSMEKMLKF